MPSSPTALQGRPSTTPELLQERVTASGRVLEPLVIVPPNRLGERLALATFIVAPILALAAAAPAAWGWGLGWRDLAIAAVMYVITSHGITVGYHRFFTHGSFKAGRGVTIALAVAGSMAIEGPVIRWVADHRRHHAFSDQAGDPHSPWRYGDTMGALAKGLFHAHIGWMFNLEKSNPNRYCPDLQANRDVAAISRYFWVFVVLSLGLPAAAGGVISGTWTGAVTALFWGGLVRVGLLHHVTWSINSICHTMGDRPFASCDRSGNVWWLALLSNGESWHNLHHADPTCARHGVLRGQIDSSAGLIRLLERAGLATAVRWPSAERLNARRV